MNENENKSENIKSVDLEETFQSKYENKLARGFLLEEFKMRQKNHFFDKALAKIISWA